MDLAQFVIVQYTHYLFRSLLNFDYVQKFINCPDLDYMHTKPILPRGFIEPILLKNSGMIARPSAFYRIRTPPAQQLSPLTDA